MGTKILVSRVVTARRLGVRRSTVNAMGLGINVVNIVSAKTAPIVDLFNIYFVVSTEHQYFSIL